MRRRLAAVLLCVVACAARAHVSSNGFLDAGVDGDRVSGFLEIAARDAELAVGVDANGDGRITWGEMRAAQPRLEAYLRDHIELAVDAGTCPLRFGAMAVQARVDGHYAWLPYEAHCPGAVRQLHVRYRVLAGIDPSHRGLLTLRVGGETVSAVLGGSDAPASFSGAGVSALRTLGDYAHAGVEHIAGGIDHLLFLISLLLPAVLRREEGRWRPVPRPWEALRGVVRVVTAFTVAHSLTLSLAALGWIRLPSRLTESAIAASIVAAALNNVWPLVTEGRTAVAFGFGLLHGFGFASALAEMGLPSGARALALFGFNLGIEAGQLAVVALVMPALYASRTSAPYRRAVLPWGSALIAGIAAVWFVQRTFLPSG